MRPCRCLPIAWWLVPLRCDAMISLQHICTDRWNLADPLHALYFISIFSLNPIKIYSNS